MYARILVPLDGSERAERVLPHATEIARRFDATIVLLQVLTARTEVLQTAIEDEGVGTRKVDLADQLVKAEAEHAGDYFARVQTGLDAAGIAHEVILVEGETTKELAATVRERQIDLVAMTTPSRSMLGRLLHGGTTAESVLHDIDVPVLLLRAEKS